MMKRLFLLRHAKSSWDDPSLDDYERPLAKRGRRASKAIAGYLRQERIAPDLVLCSSARRAQETLERIMAGLGSDVEVRVERDLYSASAVDLVGRLREVPAEITSVMLIGHNPAIQELALTLAARGTEIATIRQKFPTGALATLVFDGDWGELVPGGAELVGLVKPRDLPA